MRYLRWLRDFCRFVWRESPVGGRYSIGQAAELASVLNLGEASTVQTVLEVMAEIERRRK